MIKVYAFDFDGVLVENHNEIPYFARIAWKKTTNTECVAHDDDIIKFRPFTRNALEIYAVIMLLEKNTPVTKNEIQRTVASDKETAERFAHYFYEERHRLQEEDKPKWLGLYEKITQAIKVFNDLSKDSKVYIVSSKDKKTIVNLVRHFGIKIEDDHVLAKEISFDKLHHMNIIREREGVEYSDIIFIDDAIEHLKPLAAKGVKTVLAAWGYATENDVAEAKSLGIKIATKDNFEHVIGLEYFDVIDENNKVIGKAPRDECHKKGLLHRAVHIMIINKDCSILLQKRTMTKDLYPGWWTSSASGHVESGSNYSESAHRELKEEIGVKAKLTPMFVIMKKYSGEGKIDNERIQFFAGRHNGPFKVNKDEVDFVKFFTLEEALGITRKEKITPATIQVIEELSRRPELLKRLQKL